jgi:hypothetical protein
MAPKLRRGPILCDAGRGEHPALNPQVVTLGDGRPRVMCANCALCTSNDAIRAGEVCLTEPLARVQARDRARRRRAPAAQAGEQELAEVVNLKDGRR